MAPIKSRPAPHIQPRAKAGALDALGVALMETVANQPSVGDLLIGILEIAQEKLPMGSAADLAPTASRDWLFWLADQVEIIRNESEERSAGE